MLLATAALLTFRAVQGMDICARFVAGTSANGIDEIVSYFPVRVRLNRVGF
jgi:hypothetical protein